MNKIDWTLLIGYPLKEATEYLDEEEQKYQVVLAVPPKKVTMDQEDEGEEARVIGVRVADDSVKLICAYPDWSIA